MTVPDPAVLRGLAGRLARAGSAYGESGIRVRSTMSAAADGAAWLGRAAEQAAHAHDRRHRDLTRIDDLVCSAARTLTWLAGAIEKDSQDLVEPFRDVQTALLIGFADNTACGALNAAGEGLRALARTAPGALTDGLLCSADARVLAALGLLDRTALPFPQVLADVKALARQGDPVAVRAYLDSLSQDQWDRLAHDQPALTGSLDGTPPTLRYAANRVQLEQALAAALKGGQLSRGAHLGELLADPRRQFLLVDVRGDGRVVEVFGNLDEAAHVTVFVPGITKTLDNFDDPGGMRDDARAVQAQASAAGRGSVATIAWLGYDTPGFLGAPFAAVARLAAHTLIRAVDGLLLRPGVMTTVVAHSYGSVVAGYAVRDGLRVDNVAVLGSPGMGVAEAAGLHAALGTRLFAARAPGDPVSYSENFGGDPSDPRFGATRIATGSGPGAPVGHSDYLNPGTESTRNLARITMGDYDHVTVAQDSLAERLARDPSAVEHALRDPLENVEPEPLRRLEHLDHRLKDPDLWADGGTDLVHGIEEQLQHVRAPTW